MVKVLLEAGANPNVEDMSGTPLSTAPDADSVRLLVNTAANLHHNSCSGQSIIESVVTTIALTDWTLSGS